jgi:hypothetical protein
VGVVTGSMHSKIASRAEVRWARRHPSGSSFLDGVDERLSDGVVVPALPFATMRDPGSPRSGSDASELGRGVLAAAVAVEDHSNQWSVAGDGQCKGTVTRSARTWSAGGRRCRSPWPDTASPRIRSSLTLHHRSDLACVDGEVPADQVHPRRGRRVRNRGAPRVRRRRLDMTRARASTGRSLVEPVGVDPDPQQQLDVLPLAPYAAGGPGTQRRTGRPQATGTRGPRSHASRPGCCASPLR